MDRQQLAKQWNDAWTEGLWAASWSKSVEGLTPQQAAWTPAPGRHSIWQNVLPVIFWREDALERLETGRGALSDDEVARRNFPSPAEVSAAAWEKTVARLHQSQERVGAALANPKHSLERLQYLLPHDCYHFGQINLLRG